MLLTETDPTRRASLQAVDFTFAEEGTRRRAASESTSSAAGKARACCGDCAASLMF